MHKDLFYCHLFSVSVSEPKMTKEKAEAEKKSLSSISRNQIEQFTTGVLKIDLIDGFE